MIFIVDDLGDFGDDIATALDLEPIPDLHAEALDFVHVVEGGVADGSAADRNRSEHGNRCELSRAADLHADVFQFGDACARGVFVRDGPARSFSSEAEFVLQCSAIDFDDDAIDFVRQRFALRFPLLNEIPDFRH